ncbi:MAG TPA: hypothetical protein VMZ06_18615, partial [Candidatus Bathyarchaeia archaeon]|nr:hypothetical protein [Candidatus Bathyarchaeia archaeon]
SQEPVWPRGTGVAKDHSEYVLTLPGLGGQVADAALCDVETLSWTPVDIERLDNDIKIRLRTNWALIILRKTAGPAVVSFDSLPVLHKGDSTTIHPRVLCGDPASSVLVSAPGLAVLPATVGVPDETQITVPPDAFAGNYAVTIGGNHVLGAKRFLTVE